MSAVELPRLHLPAEYLSIVRNIMRTHLPEVDVWAYGSRVNGDCCDTSDLDLVVRQPDDLHHRQTRLGDVIEAFSESNLPIIVQLVDWAAIPAAFRAEITAKYVVIQQGTRSVDPAEAGGPGYEF